jgi:hypothetical protein
MNATWIPQLRTYIGQTRPYLNALLVIRYGYLVFEHYNEPFPGAYHRLFIPSVFLLPAIQDK